MHTNTTNQRWIFILLTSLFLFWGLANNMTDTLLAAFKRIMSMGDFQTTFVQYAFYGAYFCLAIPASILAQKFSYKTSILMGLGLFIGGALLFYPASQTQVYSHFLGALFILAGGLSILQTATNPFILTLGSRETAVKRLNLAQSFNPIGSIIGVALSKFLILSELHAATAEQRETMSKEANSQLAIRQEKFIRDLKNALFRVENKTYGVCKVTGKLISKERLKIVPHATMSIEAKNLQR